MEIHNGDLALHVAVDGPEDAPPVLVLHGITASIATWNWLVPLLAPTHRVLRLDFRGHGGSGRAPGHYDSAGYVSDAVAVCEQVAGRPVIVIGHSLGGVTALGLAQTRPDLVRGLALEDPPMGVPRTLEGNSLLDAFTMMRETVPMLQQSGMDATALAGVLAAAPGVSGAPMGEVLLPDAVLAMAEALLQLDASVLDPVLAPLAGGEGAVEPMTWVFDVNRAIGVPTLLLAADPAMPDCVCRPDDIALAEAASGEQLRVHTVTGCGHLVHDSMQFRRAMADLVVEQVRALT